VLRSSPYPQPTQRQHSSPLLMILSFLSTLPSTERATAPKKNLNPGNRCSLRPRTKSQRTTQRTELPISLPPTSFLTGLPLNISHSSDTKALKEAPLTRSPVYALAQPTSLSIGDHMVRSLLLRTKVYAEHAGHSLPLVPLKELTCLAAHPIRRLSHSQSNN
jgi:hypothetical protein